jgi:hypothetical protein
MVWDALRPVKQYMLRSPKMDIYTLEFDGSEWFMLGPMNQRGRIKRAASFRGSFKDSARVKDEANEWLVKNSK